MSQWLNLAKFSFLGFPVDWLVHFIIGGVLLCFLIKVMRFKRSVAILVTLLISFAKEVIDFLPFLAHEGLWNSWIDLLMTLVGVICADFMIRQSKEVKIKVRRIHRPLYPKRLSLFESFSVGARRKLYGGAMRAKSHPGKSLRIRYKS